MDSVHSSAAEHDSDISETDKTKTVEINHSRPQEENESLPTIPAIASVNKLGEDELLLIFRFRKLSTRDLFNMRLVSKTWRDAATSTLLRRDACYVALSNQNGSPFGNKDDDKGDSTDNRIQFLSLKFGAIRNTLTELTELMTKSPKFPASNFYIEAIYPSSDYTCYPDLMLFFKLHGDKIRMLRPRGRICLEPLLEILSTYTPNMESLDLNLATFSHAEEKRGETKSNTNCIPVKYLTMGHCVEGLPLLLSSLPKLSAIEKVSQTMLRHIMTEGKGHLVRSIGFGYFPLSDPLIQQFPAVHPQLCELVLMTLDISCSATWILINALLESSKDTLKHLMLPVPPPEYQAKLRIPHMKNVKSIDFKGKGLYRSTIPDENEQIDEILINSMFEDGLSASDYFPSLVKLSFRDLNVEQTIKSFFQFQLDSDGTPNKNSLPKIETLEILRASLAKNSNLSLISKFTPNVRTLNLYFPDFKIFTNSFWPLFPLLEFLEITAEDVVKDESSFSYCIDQFFTGFSSEMCTELRTGATEIPESLNNAEGFKSLRVAPSICDLLHLKELKLKNNLDFEFLSWVTGLYAFSQMPKTQFVISYDPNILAFRRLRGNQYKNSDDYLHFDESFFGSIKPYVEIVYESTTHDIF